MVFPLAFFTTPGKLLLVELSKHPSVYSKKIIASQYKSNVSLPNMV
jgi:hypothetical protein